MNPFLADLVRVLARAAVAKETPTPTPWERKQIRRALFEEQGGLCGLCGEPMLPLKVTGACAPRAATIDHIVARSLGGGWERPNLRLAHKACNTERKDGRRVREA